MTGLLLLDPSAEQRRQRGQIMYLDRHTKNDAWAPGRRFKFPPSVILDHPVVVLPATLINDNVLVFQVRSFGGTSIAETYPNKPGARRRFLPVRPADHPDSARVLALANGKALAKKSYVKIGKVYEIPYSKLRPDRENIDCRLDESSCRTMIDAAAAYAPTLRSLLRPPQSVIPPVVEAAAPPTVEAAVPAFVEAVPGHPYRPPLRYTYAEPSRNREEAPLRQPRYAANVCSAEGQRSPIGGYTYGTVGPSSANRTPICARRRLAGWMSRAWGWLRRNGPPSDVVVKWVAWLLITGAVLYGSYRAVAWMVGLVMALWEYLAKLPNDVWEWVRRLWDGVWESVCGAGSGVIRLG